MRASNDMGIAGHQIVGRLGGQSSGSSRRIALPFKRLLPSCGRGSGCAPLIGFDGSSGPRPRCGLKPHRGRAHGGHVHWPAAAPRAPERKRPIGAVGLPGFRGADSGTRWGRYERGTTAPVNNRHHTAPRSQATRPRRAVSGRAPCARGAMTLRSRCVQRRHA